MSISQDSGNSSKISSAHSFNSYISDNNANLLAIGAVVATCSSSVDALAIMKHIPICDARINFSNFAMIFGYSMSWASGLFYFFSRVPQLMQNHERKSVKGLSKLLFVLTIFGIKRINLLFRKLILWRFYSLKNASY